MVSSPSSKRRKSGLNDAMKSLLIDLVRPLEQRPEHDARREEFGVKNKKLAGKEAMVVASSRQFPSVDNNFKTKFFSQSSEKSRICKRNEVMELACREWQNPSH